MIRTRTLTLYALAMIAFVSIAKADATDNIFKQGFYLGGSLGAGWGHGIWDGVTDLNGINDQGTPVSSIAYWKPSGDAIDTVFAGRVMAGYQFVYRPLYLAFELGGTFSEDYRLNRDEEKEFFNMFLLSTVDGFVRTDDTVTLNGSEFNADLKTGWVLTNQLLAYGRVGLAVNELNIESNASWITVNTDPLGGFPVPLILTGQGTSSDSHTAYGIRLGLGAEFLATRHLGVTLDYTYTYYGNIGTTSAGQATTAGGAPPMYYSVSGINSPNVTVSTQTAMLGFLWHW